MKLRYGMNPHQQDAAIYLPSPSPLKMLNWQPGFINLLDAFNAWQLVRELRHATSLPAAASFKHVNPAGAAVARPLTTRLTRSYQVDGMDLSPLAVAYARARGTDRMSSYGDFVALSDVVDAQTAALLTKEVSDGVIAPGYDSAALRHLTKKRGGKYLVLQMDSDYVAPHPESRDVYGFHMTQSRNDLLVDGDLLTNIVTTNKTIPDDRRTDALIGLIVQKYTQSNSINICFDGQTIGIGAGQQSRVYCTKIAVDKASTWFLRQTDTILSQSTYRESSRNETDNLILAAIEKLPLQQRQELLSESKDWVMVSDGYIPFRDNIDICSQAGIRYIIQPGSSLHDEDIIRASNEHKMVMVFTGKRLFHH